jgi:hypothetical protein
MITPFVKQPAELFSMSDASLPSHAIVDSEAPSFQQSAKRRGFFAAFVEALHHSRRLEAQRILRRYQHLIDSNNRDQILKGVEDVHER